MTAPAAVSYAVLLTQTNRAYREADPVQREALHRLDRQRLPAVDHVARLKEIMRWA